uniref:MHC class I-like antigen recognition-like domain-containing protein n=1 Tax=Coturnix japonica TaxID=93934 RepID=A0A8C2YDX6_COTJA
WGRGGLWRLGLLLCAVCGAAGELHTLRYFQTAMTDPGPELPCTARRYVPRTEWMAASMDQQYWDGQTEIAQSNEQKDRVSLVNLARLYNQSGGSHTWQRMLGCDILEDGTTRGYHQYGYDGRDFIAFDKDTMTFTAAVPEAVPTKRKWEEGGDAERQKHYLEEICPQWLWRYVEHGKAELGRTEQPEVRVWGKEADGILTLSCRAHGFYPRPTLSDTHSGGIVPNSYGTYHTLVTIDAVPGDGDKYQCCVEHASLPQPKWPQPSLVPIIVRVVIPIVVIAITAGIGFTIYRRHAGKSGGVWEDSGSCRGV